MAAELEARMATLADKPVHRFASKEEACTAAAAARRSAEATKAEKESKGKGKGKGKGMCKGKDVEHEASKGKGKVTPVQSAPKEGSAWWAMREAKDFAKAHPEPFDVKLSVRLPEGEPRRLVLRGVRYMRPDGEPATGRHLREQIAREIGGDPRQMRLLLHRELEDGEAVPGAALGDHAMLAAHRLGEVGELEVLRKRRGGKRPGRGWHKNPPGKLTYSTGIAAAVVRESVFAHVAQYHTVV